MRRKPTSEEQAAERDARERERYMARALALLCALDEKRALLKAARKSNPNPTKETR